MRHASIRQSQIPLVALLLVVTVMAGVGQAQGRSGCSASQPPNVGVAFGRSSPYLELASGVVETSGSGSVLVYGGRLFSGRAELPIAGPWRVRVQGWTGRWDVRLKRYDPNAGYQEIEDTSVGHMSARHIGAAIGRTAGREPACGYVLAGGGLYSLSFRGDGIRRPGFSITAGIELSTGRRGVVQIEAQVQMITTRDGYPIASTAVPVASLTAGWAYRFR